MLHSAIDRVTDLDPARQYHNEVDQKIALIEKYGSPSTTTPAFRMTPAGGVPPGEAGEMSTEVEGSLDMIA